MSDKPITEMNASFNYIFDRLCMSYPASEARAIARLVLETRFGLHANRHLHGTGPDFLLTKNAGTLKIL